MLGITDIDPGQTRFYQDVFADGQAEGQTEGRRSEAANLLRRLLEAESLEAVFAPLGDDSNPDA